MLTGVLEENVLTALCFSNSATALAARLNRDVFSSRAYKHIADAALNYIERYHEPPRFHLRDLLESRLNKGDEGRLLLRTILDMEKLAPELNVTFVTDSLDRFISLRKLTDSIDKAAEFADRGDLEKGWEEILKGRVPVRHSTGLWLADTNRALRFMEYREEDYFATGISVLDDHGIRPQRKTMLLLIAPTGFGKTWFLVECGKHKKVLHISMEMDEDFVAQRYVQSFLALTDEKAETLELTYFDKDEEGLLLDQYFKSIYAESATEENRKRIVERLQFLERRPPFRIEAFPSGTLSLTQYENYLDTMEQEFDFVPDLVLMDYPDLMKMDGESLRISLNQTFVGIRGIAQARNHALVIVTQGNRGSSTAKTVRANMVTEDWSKAATSDKILTYSQTEEELRQNRARLFVEKGRTKRDKWTVAITQSYATGQFCIDSVRFTKQAQKLLAEVDEDADQQRRH
jgi:hypothetical protein